jgi:hypothetical protein
MERVIEVFVELDGSSQFVGRLWSRLCRDSQRRKATGSDEDEPSFGVNLSAVQTLKTGPSACKLRASLSQGQSNTPTIP